MIYINFTRPDGPRRNLLTYTERLFDTAYWDVGATLANFYTVTSSTDIANFRGESGGVSKFVATASTAILFLRKTQSIFIGPKAASIWVYVPSQAGVTSWSIQCDAADFEASELFTSTLFNVWIRAIVPGLTPAATRAFFDYNILANGNVPSTGFVFYASGAQLENNGVTEYQPVVSGLEFSLEPLNHARIGYDNLASGLTPTASTSAAGHPAISATYPTTFEFWTPTALPATWAVDLGSAKTVDYFGMVGDMNGCTVALQSSTDNSTWTTQDTRTSITDRINMFLILPVTARYWRLSISVAIPLLSVVYLGQALAMQRKIYQGHTPLTLSRETELSNNMSEGGQYLGRSIIRKGASTSADWQHLRADWYRANFDPFVESAREYPFFIGWRPEQYPNELGFVWTGGDISPQNTGPRDFMSVGMSFRGLINE